MKPHPTIEKACALLRVHWPTCKDWTEDQLLNWIGFFNRHRQCAVVMDGDECVGFVAFRFLNSIEEAKTPLFTRQDGRIAWIEMVIATKAMAVQTMTLALLNCIERIGARIELMGGEDIRTDRVKLYPFKRYLNLIFSKIKNTG